jgi:hypothetical protein
LQSANRNLEQLAWLPSEFWQPDRDAKTKTILSTPKAP